MSTLTTLRASLRQDLHDEDSANYRWTDAVLARHIQRALERYQHEWPVETDGSITPAAAAVRFATSSLTGLLWVEKVWYPYDTAAEPVWIPFAERGGFVYRTEEDESFDGASAARVFYAKAHTVDTNGSTIPVEHEHVVLTGATAAALADVMIRSTNVVNLSRFTPRELRALWEAKQREFEAQLDDLRRLRIARGDGRVTWQFEDSTGRDIE